MAVYGFGLPEEVVAAVTGEEMEAAKSGLDLHEDWRSYSIMDGSVVYDELIAMDGALHYNSAALCVTNKAVSKSNHDYHRRNFVHYLANVDAAAAAGDQTKRSRAIATAIRNSGYTVSDKALTMLGELSATLQARYVRPPFNWQSGDYGDAGSCFWNGRTMARELMASLPGFRALQLRRQNGKGVGRCWLRLTHDVQSAILFNAYGIRLELIRQFVWPQGRIVSNRWHNDYSGVMYINGGQGLLVGELAKNKNLDMVDMYTNKHFTPTKPKCPKCSHGIEHPHIYGGRLQCYSCPTAS